LDVAKLSAAVEKMQRTRLENQEWTTAEQQRGCVLANVAERFGRLNEGKGGMMMERQRYELKGWKQYEVFVERVVGKMKEGRLEGQDAAGKKGGAVEGEEEGRMMEKRRWRFSSAELLLALKKRREEEKEEEEEEEKTAMKEGNKKKMDRERKVKSVRFAL